MIPRCHLFEVEDQSWCPGWLRDAMTGYLHTIISLSRPYSPAVPLLAALLKEQGATTVVDLCSGAGGPWPALRSELAARGAAVTVTCTDLAPNVEAARRLEGVEGFRYLTRPVSALAVPSTLGGARTMFSALHHFSPQDAHALLADAQAAGVPFAAFEASSRRWTGLLATLVIPFAALALMPIVRPRRVVALWFTYLPPLVPLAIWWDGFVSTLRTYRAEELRTIVRSLPAASYEWTVEELPGGPLPVLAILGRPRGSQR